MTVRGSTFTNWYVPLSALDAHEQARYFTMIQEAGQRSTARCIEIRQQIIDERPDPTPTTPGGVRRRK